VRLQTHAEVLLKTSKALVERSAEERQKQVWVDYQADFNAGLATLHKPMAFYAWFCLFADIESPVRKFGEYSAALASLNDLDAAFTEKPDELLAGNWIGKAKGNLGLLAAGLSARAALDWENYRESLHWERAEVWVPFRGHAQHGSAVSRAEEQDRKFDSMSEFPWTEEKQTQFESLLKNRAETLASLPAIDNEEVKDFIQRAAGQGVALSDVSTGVLKWLRKNGLLESYVVRRK